MTDISVLLHRASIEEILRRRCLAHTPVIQRPLELKAKLPIVSTSELISPPCSEFNRLTARSGSSRVYLWKGYDELTVVLLNLEGSLNAARSCFGDHKL